MDDTPSPMEQPVINEQIVEVLTAIQVALEHLRLRTDILAAKVEAHESELIALFTERNTDGTPTDH